MAEYIEMGKAKRYFKNIDSGRRGCSTLMAPTEFAEYLDEIEIADVAPVVHGRWIHTAIEDDDWGGTFHSWTCSNCDFSTCRNQNGTNYCPNCGARMDLEANDGIAKN